MNDNNNNNNNNQDYNYYERYSKPLTSSVILGLNEETNEFSVFYSEFDELRQDNNDDGIYEFLIKKYKTKSDEDEFISFFYNNNYTSFTHLQAKDFVSVGIFEDLSYYSIWMNNNSLTSAIQTLKNKHNIYYWHRTKGDGNCFYRSVLISYFEIIISKSITEKNPNIFFNIVKEFLFTKFPENKRKFHSKTLTVLLFIYEEIKQNNEKAFDILYRAFNLSDSVEKSLILWFKIKLVLFLKQNLELEIAGIKLIQCIPYLDLNDDMTYDINQVIEYIDNKLLKTNEYVEGYPLYITPFILKCNLDIYYLSNVDYSIKKEEMVYHKDLMFAPVDTYLPFLNNDVKYNISLLFKDPHYEALAGRERVNDIVEIYSNPDIILVEGIKNENDYDKYKTTVLENINSVNRKRMSAQKGEILDKKFTNSEMKCSKCNKEMNLGLPCGCVVCWSCSYDIIMKGNCDGNKEEVHICKCKYELDENDKKMILNFKK